MGSFHLLLEGVKALGLSFIDGHSDGKAQSPTKDPSDEGLQDESSSHADAQRQGQHYQVLTEQLRALEGRIQERIGMGVKEHPERMLKEISALKAKIRAGDMALPARAQSACRSAAEEATRLNEQAAGLIIAIQSDFKGHAAIAKVSF